MDLYGTRYQTQNDILHPKALNKKKPFFIALVTFSLSVRLFAWLNAI